MSNIALKPESDLKVLGTNTVAPNMMLDVLAGMTKDGPTAAVHTTLRDSKPIPVKIREVNGQSLRLQAIGSVSDGSGGLEGGSGIFVGQQERYKIQFKIGRLSRVRLAPAQDGSVPKGIFYDCELPNEVWRINQRETFRAETGENTPVWARIRTPERRQIVLKVMDVSAGGVGLELRSGNNTVDISVGTTWEDCTIRLGDDGREVRCTLKVTSIGNTPGRNNVKHVGCQLRLRNPAHAGVFQMLIFDVQTGNREAESD